MHRCGSGQLIGLVLGLSACGSTTFDEPTAESQFSVTESFAAIADVAIVKAFPITNFGGTPNCGAVGNQLPSGRSCLMRFNVPEIPNVTVTSAWLDLRVTDTSGQTFAVYKVNSPWVESEATWNQSRAGVPWQVPGALGSADRGPSVGLGIFDQPDETVNFTLNGGLQMVQSWFTSPATNYGVIVANDVNDDRVLFATREHATPEYRPTLNVNYTLNSNGGTNGSGGTNSTGGGPIGGIGGASSGGAGRGS